LAESGYFRAKLVQEYLVRMSLIPYTILRATQFFEFIESIADAATDDNTSRIPPVLFQPMAMDDAAKAVARAAVRPSSNEIAETGGPERFRMDELVRRVLAARSDPREVVTDPRARYFGARLSKGTLVPGDGAVIGETRFDDWLRSSAAIKQSSRLAAPADGPAGGTIPSSNTEPHHELHLTGIPAPGSTGSTQ